MSIFFLTEYKLGFNDLYNRIYHVYAQFYSSARENTSENLIQNVLCLLPDLSSFSSYVPVKLIMDHIIKGMKDKQEAYIIVKQYVTM